jgi:uncharacterized protein YndB with AHSA1/START domain
MGTILNSHTVKYERLLPGPIENVWEHISFPEKIYKWQRCSADVSIELAIGGRVSFKICSPDGHPTPVPVEGLIQNPRGLVNQCTPPWVLAYSFMDPACGLASNVRYELEERDGNVRLVFTHSHLSPEFMVHVGAGWHVHLDTLVAILNGEEPVEFLPAFMELVKQYSAIIGAGIIVTSSIAPAIAAPDDIAYKALSQQRQEHLRTYDRVWKEADRIKDQIDILKHTDGDVGRALDELDRELRYKYQDLRKIELNVRDLDRDVVRL